MILSTSSTNTISDIHSVLRGNGRIIPRRVVNRFLPQLLEVAISATTDVPFATSLSKISQRRSVKSGHFHVACTRVFEITHSRLGVKKGEGVGGGESVTHPNQYAARSMELEKANGENNADDRMVVDKI